MTEAHNSVQNIIETLQFVKKEVDDYHMQWYSTAVKLAAKVEVVPTKPRTAATMRHRANIPAENQESHFKINFTIPIYRQGILFHRKNINVMTGVVVFINLC